MLQILRPDQVPQIWLYEAHALFTQWDYEKAIPVLRKYVKADLSDYQRTIGKVNLASAYVHERYFEEAKHLLMELEEETRRNRLHALYGNTLERFAELAILERDWKSAERHLADADRAVKEAGGFDEFFVRKWRSILHLYQQPKAGSQEVKKLRGEAEKLSHWETVRECDAYRAIVTQNHDLLLRVYFGTPFPSYRKRLLQDFKASITIPEQFEWELLGEGKLKARCDLLIDNSAFKDLKFGQVKHRLLKTLASDFYRPFRVAHLFSEIYPGERFRLNSSRARIHVGVRDLKLWLKGKRLPLQVVERRGEYQLHSKGPSVTLSIPSPQWWEKHSLKGLAELRARAGANPFSAADVAKWLALPRRTAFELIKEALEQRLLVKSGAGPHTRYKLAAPNT